MTELLRALARAIGRLRAWVVVAPAELGALSRLGRPYRALAPGWYWKLPLLDRVTVVNSRRRFPNLPLLDLTSFDCKPLQLGLTIGFGISDLPALLMSVAQPEDAVADLTAGFTTSYVIERDRGDFEVSAFEQAAAAFVNDGVAGLERVAVRVTSLSYARPLRLITDKRWSSWGDTTKWEVR